jgi:hypothetical protein
LLSLDDMAIRVTSLCVALALVCCAAGCEGRPRTPEEAYLAIERALLAGDGAALYRALDQETRWSVESTLRDQRLMRTIISAKYPEDEAGRALLQLEAAAETQPARYFGMVVERRGLLERYRARLGPKEAPLSLRPDGENAVMAARGTGSPLRLLRGRDGSWGLAELAPEWALERDRASHAVSTVRENAALYQKAGRL